MMSFCNYISLTHNSIYNLHFSYYSINFSFSIINMIIYIWLIIWGYLVFISYYIIYLFLIMWLSCLNWINDFYFESFLGLTIIEQFSIINSLKWFIFSEFMLFFSCFWSLFNFSIISYNLSLFISYPLLSYYSFTMPICNLFMLLFSSLSIQAIQMFIKIGFLILTIEGFGQSMLCGMLFIILQYKEFLYSYFSMSDCIIGCMFYLTTGLHGIHVIIGCFGFMMIICLISFPIYNSINLYYFYFSPFNSTIYYFNPDFFIEFGLSILLCSYYWHFVDWIWLFVFLVYFIILLLIIVLF